MRHLLEGLKYFENTRTGSVLSSAFHQECIFSYGKSYWSRNIWESDPSSTIEIITLSSLHCNVNFGINNLMEYMCFWTLTAYSSLSLYSCQIYRININIDRVQERSINVSILFQQIAMATLGHKFFLTYLEFFFNCDLISQRTPRILTEIVWTYRLTWGIIYYN